jgi:hypothetical protein
VRFAKAEAVQAKSKKKRAKRAYANLWRRQEARTETLMPFYSACDVVRNCVDFSRNQGTRSSFRPVIAVAAVAKSQQRAHACLNA